MSVFLSKLPDTDSPPFELCRPQLPAGHDADAVAAEAADVGGSDSKKKDKKKDEKNKKPRLTSASIAVYPNGLLGLVVRSADGPPRQTSHNHHLSVPFGGYLVDWLLFKAISNSSLALHFLFHSYLRVSIISSSFCIPSQRAFVDLQPVQTTDPYELHSESHQ